MSFYGKGNGKIYDTLCSCKKSRIYFTKLLMLLFGLIFLLTDYIKIASLVTKILRTKFILPFYFLCLDTLNLNENINLWILILRYNSLRQNFFSYFSWGLTTSKAHLNSLVLLLKSPFPSKDLNINLLFPKSPKLLFP